MKASKLPFLSTLAQKHRAVRCNRNGDNYVPQLLMTVTFKAAVAHLHAVILLFINKYDLQMGECKQHDI